MYSLTFKYKEKNTDISAWLLAGVGANNLIKKLERCHWHFIAHLKKEAD